MSDQPNDQKPAPAPRRPRGPLAAGFVAGIVGAAAVAIVLAIAADLALPWLRVQLAPPVDTSALNALADRVAALETAGGAAKSQAASGAASLDKIAQRVTALEQAPHEAAADPRVAALSDKIDQLAAQVAALKSASGDAAELDKKLAQAEAAAQTAREAAATRRSGEALLIAAGQLRDAVERGDPYAAELGALRKLAPAEAQAALDGLAASAETGVERRRALLDRFPAVADAIGRAALAPSDEDDFWTKLRHEAATLVNVRRVDGRGTDAFAIAARAEKAAKAGDLAAAVQELAALDGAPAEAAKDWLAAAKARIAADRALSDLVAKSAAALAPAGG